MSGILKGASSGPDKSTDTGLLSVGVGMIEMGGSRAIPRMYLVIKATGWDGRLREGRRFRASSPSPAPLCTHGRGGLDRGRGASQDTNRSHRLRRDRCGYGQGDGTRI